MLDVKSLFTRVPIQEALQVVERRLLDNKLLEDQTLMTGPSSILSLTKLCMHDIDLFCLQEQHLRTSGRCPNGFTSLSNTSRHIHGIFWKDGDRPNNPKAYFLAPLHRQHVCHMATWSELPWELPLTLQLCETKSPWRLSRMGIYLSWTSQYRGNKDQRTDLVYRKPPHTDHYLNFKSNHYPRVKNGIIHCLAHRAKNSESPWNHSAVRAKPFLEGICLKCLPKNN